MSNYFSLLQSIRDANKKVLVIGLGISGIETALFLTRAGIQCLAAEKLDEDKFKERSRFHERLRDLKNAGIPYLFGVDGERLAPYLNDIGLAIISPGVPLESSACAALARKNIPVMNELELGIILHNMPSIVVTGSNGKTTTVSLIEFILKQLSQRTILCGNVGRPVVSDLLPTALEGTSSPQADVLVVEASSYQLESVTKLKPKVSVFLNLTENHLERHGTMQRYFEAKAKIALLQDASDFAVLNYDDAWSRALAGRIKARVLWFGKDDFTQKGFEGARINYSSDGVSDKLELVRGGKKESFNLAGSSLLGLHNRYNIAASLCALIALGFEPSAIVEAVKRFQPLEHRLEIVNREALAEAREPLFINDSKSTTVAATVAALSCVRQSFPNRKLIVLLGGLVKAGSWDPVTNILKNQSEALREILCFGADGRIVANHLGTAGLANREVPTLRDAVAEARRLAQAGDIVLLTPGCASFDEFSDFEERGKEFKRLVQLSTEAPKALSKEQRVATL